MPTLDIDRITEHTKTIENNLRLLESLRGQSFDDFVAEADGLDAAKYRLQTAVQALMDVSNHICARLKLKIGEDSGECIRALEKRGLIPQDRATMYVKMIRFRNVLVHLYHEVDNRRIHEIIENDLDYFRLFLLDVGTIVEREQKKQTRGRAKRNG